MTSTLNSNAMAMLNAALAASNSGVNAGGGGNKDLIRVVNGQQMLVVQENNWYHAVMCGVAASKIKVRVGYGRV